MRSPIACLFLSAIAIAAALSVSGEARAGAEEIRRAESAVRVLDEMMQAPDQRIPAWLLADAEAVAVIPNVVKAGLLIAGRRGKGMISIRSDDGTWSNPSYVKLTGGSLGLQAGVQTSDVVLVFRNRRTIESLNRGKFTLGADAAVAAGPVGRFAQASTDAKLKAEIYAYSRARGLFAGIAIDGAVLGVDADANEAVFGSSTTPKMIFSGDISSVPNRLVDFRDRLEEVSVE